MHPNSNKQFKHAFSQSINSATISRFITLPNKEVRRIPLIGAITLPAATFALSLLVAVPVTLVFIFPQLVHADVVVAKPGLGKTVLNVALNPPNLNRGLVGHWTFDGKDMTKNAKDTSGQGNTGYLESFTSTTTVLGVSGQALKFSGVNQDVNTGTGLTSNFQNHSFSVSLWFNITNLNGGADEGLAGITGVANGDDSLTIIQRSNALLFGFYSDDLTGNATLKTGKWYHAVFTWDATSKKRTIYLNGAVDASDTSTGSLNVPNGQPFYMGQWFGGNYLPGSEDDVRVYNRALSQAEVTQLYNLGTATHQAVTLNPPNLNRGLVGHWTFDGKDMTKNVKDTSGQANTGYMVAAATSTQQVPGVIGQALKFNGTTQYVSIAGATSNAPTSITMSGWIKPTRTGAGGVCNAGNESQCGLFGRRFFNNLRGSALYRLTRDAFEFIWTTNAQIDNDWTPVFRFVASDAGKWAFVTITYDETTGVARFYVNGVLDSSTTVTASPLRQALGPFGIGAINDNGSWGNFLGDPIDDVREYNRALSAAEVTQLYNLGR